MLLAPTSSFLHHYALLSKHITLGILVPSVCTVIYVVYVPSIYTVIYVVYVPSICTVIYVVYVPSICTVTSECHRHRELLLSTSCCRVK